MNDQQLKKRIASLFGEAAQLEGNARREFLKELDHDVRDQLEKLLRADDRVREKGLLNSLTTARPTLTRIRDYELHEIIGEGGMGTVYRALHTRLQTEVAVKVLPISSSPRPETIARFEREMAAVGKLKHANIVQAMDAGEEGGIQYLVFECIDGTDAAKLVASCNPISISDACEIMRQTALGLQHAHQQGLIHRDVKPSNLLVSKSGQVLVADLGLALLNDSVQQNDELTSADQIMGTLDYIAPEQIDDPHAVDHRADLYSLGCTFYQLITGRAPFATPEYDRPLRKLRAHEQNPPVPASQVCPDLPADVANLVDRLLSKDPENRPASAGEVASVVEPAASNANLAKLVSLVGVTELSEQTTQPNAAIGNTDRQSLRISGKESTSAFTLPLPEFRNRGAASKPGNEKRLLTSWAMLVVVGLMAFGVSMTFLFKTGNGTIIVETEGGQIPITVAGENLSFVDPSDGKTVQVTADRENDMLRFSKQGFQSLSKSVDLKYANGQSISLRFEPTAAAMSGRETLAWAFEKGVTGVRGFVNRQLIDCRSVADLPEDVSGIDRIDIRNSSETVQIMNTLKPHITLESVSLWGDVPLDAETMRVLANQKALSEIRVYCPWSLDNIREVEHTNFPALETVGFFSTDSSSDGVTDDAVDQILERFPTVNAMEFHAQNLSTKSIQSIADSHIEDLLVVEPLPELQRNFEQLTQIKRLAILYRDKDVDLSHMPPNIERYRIDGITLRAEHFQELQKYESLTLVTQRQAPVDATAIAEFKEERPDCLVETLLVPKTGSEQITEPKATPIAAFDNRKGYGYVFYDDGRYDKIKNGTDEVVHRLPTNIFWRHLMEDFWPKLTAACTHNFDESFAFYSDGCYSKYVNGPDIGAGTFSVLDTWPESFTAKSKLVAAVHWPDDTVFVFFEDDWCHQLNADCSLRDSDKVATMFPNLSGAGSPSAARVDPTTQLAYFYFADNTVRVIDTKDRVIISHHPVGSTKWQVPPTYAERANSVTIARRSTSYEGIRWAFDNGLVRMTYRKENGETQEVRSSDEFSLDQRPFETVEVDTSHAFAHQVILIVHRFSPVEKIELRGNVAVNDQAISRLKSNALRELEFDCPVSANQLQRVPMRHRITRLVLNSTPDDESIDVLAREFQKLRNLVIDVRRLPDCPALQTMPLTRLTLVNAGQDNLRTLDQLPKTLEHISVIGKHLEFSDQQFDALMKVPGLKVVELTGVQCDPEEIAAFKAATECELTLE